MCDIKYTLVPDNMELAEVVTDGKLNRKTSLEPTASLTGSSVSSQCITRDRKRHDRRKERLNTELLTAVLNNDRAQVLRLLEIGASPDATCRPSRTSAIHIAALKGDITLLDDLLRANADLSLRDRAGRQAIHMAAWGGHLPALSAILRAENDLLNSRITPEDEPSHEIECLDSWNHNHDLLLHLVPEDVSEGSTALHLACKRGHVNCVNLLLNMKADVNITDAQGLTPIDVTGLSYEAPTKHPPKEKTKEQTDDGFTFDTAEHPRKPSSLVPPSTFVKTARFIKNDVTRQTHPEPREMKPLHKIVNVLMERGATMPKGNVILREGTARQLKKMPVTTLHTAVAKEEIELIECLLRNNASLETWNDAGETPLHLAVKKWSLETLKKMVSWDPKKVDVRDSHGRTPLFLAVMQEWPNGVEILLEAGADVKISSSTNETVLHMAAECGNTAMLEELLSISDSHKILERRNNYYQTPVFRAVENNHLPCVELLCENDADMTITLPGDLTLLHIAAWNNSPDIIEYLLHDPSVARRIKDVRCGEVKGGLTALHVAAKHGFAECVKELLRGGCDVHRPTTDGEKCATALHLAAKNGHLEVVEAIIDHDKKTLISVNKDGWQPLHVAAAFAQGKCVKHMLQNGADISEVIVEEGGRKTALDMILYSVPQPVDFLEEIFDSYMEKNEFALTEPECEITLKYDILVPCTKQNKSNKKVESTKQLKVLNAILNCGKHSLQERILLHPLVEIFLFLKWRKLRIFFFFVMTLHVILTAMLTILAHLTYVEKTADTILMICAEVARIVMYTCLFPIVIVELVNASQLQRYYFLDYESWVKWAVIASSFTVGLVDPRVAWARYLTSIAVLLSWIELLFLLAHCPAWGFYVLMFSRVAANVVKVLGTFTFLVLGFTFAFLILFEANTPFRNLLESLIKVIVMMLEFDYENMFEQTKDITAFSIIGRFMFVTFVILVSMVMMNLMVGLAVSDIAALEAQGRTQRLAKQAAFLSLLELCVYNEKLKKILPTPIFRRLEERRAVPGKTIIMPAKPIHSDTNPIPRCLRDEVLDKVWNTHNDGSVEVRISLHDINSKIDQLAGIVDKKLTNTSTSSSDSSSTSSKDSEKTITHTYKNILEEILSEQRALKQQIENLRQRNDALSAINSLSLNEHDQPRLI